MTVRIAKDPHIHLRLVLHQRRAQGTRPFGLRLQIVDLHVQVRLHLLSARPLRPHRRNVIGLQLEAEAVVDTGEGGGLPGLTAGHHRRQHGETGINTEPRCSAQNLPGDQFVEPHDLLSQ